MTLNGTFSFPPPDSDRPPGAVRWQGVDNRGIHMWIKADGSLMRGAPLAGATPWTTLVGVPKDLDFQPLTDLMQRYIANLGSVVAAAKRSLRTHGITNPPLSQQLRSGRSSGPIHRESMEARARAAPGIPYPRALPMRFYGEAQLALRGLSLTLPMTP
jgi:hypothetical protein